MQKIVVEFPDSFEADGVYAINLGRLYLGDRAVRHIFCPDGKARLVISKKDIEAGLIIIAEEGEAYL